MPKSPPTREGLKKLKKDLTKRIAKYKAKFDDKTNAYEAELAEHEETYRRPLKRSSRRRDTIGDNNDVSNSSVNLADSYTAPNKRARTKGT